jgi:phosphoenolpyruvate phosphomutase
MATGENEKAGALRRLLEQKPVARVMGAHDGMSALLAQEAGFDGVWASGLGISAVRGVPDCSVLTMTEFLSAGTIINQSTTLPVIADCDNGFGDVNCLTRAVQGYEQAGIAAICLEDKRGPKRNSFRNGHCLAEPEEFATKLAAAKTAQRGDDLVVVARLESFIAGAGQEDALERGELYAEAGADALLVHSKERTPDQVLGFATHWRERGGELPLVVVPTTYPQVTLEELEEAGIALVIYANQSLRAAIMAMRNALREIGSSGSTSETEASIVSIDDVLTLVGTVEAEERDAWFEAAVATRRQARATRQGAGHLVGRES